MPTSAPAWKFRSGSLHGFAGEPERDPHVFAGRIVQGEHDLVTFARAAGGDPRVTRLLALPLSSMLGIELGEQLVHGFDVTRAVGLAWPIEPAAAALALGGEMQALRMCSKPSSALRLSP